MSNIYTSGEYNQKNPTYHVEDSPWKARQILKMMQLHHLQPDSICEVGCGAGEILYQLQKQIPSHTEFYGYEISEDGYKMCEQRRNAHLHFYHGNLLQEPAVQYDLLLCIDVFEHVEDYLGFLRHLRAKGKQFIFHIPLDLSLLILSRPKRLLELRNQVGHLHYFAKETALATLTDAGYGIIDHFYTPSILELERNSGLTTQLLYWPRKLLFAYQPDHAARYLGGFSLLVFAQ